MIPLSPSSKYLIVNGDDFGLSLQVNAGILYAHRNGILTNTSLMVTGRAWEEAVAQATAVPSLSVGLHLTLVQGRSVLPPHLVPDLTDAHGNFSANPTLAGLRYFFSRRAREQLQAECHAQIERFLATGLTPAQIDGHVNIHMHPTVLEIVLSLAQEYGIPALRVTREELPLALTLDPRHRVRKAWESLIFTALSRSAAKKMRRLGMYFPDRLFGLHQSGDVNEAYLLKLIPRLREGVTELYCHPSFLPCPEVHYWTPHYQREGELRALTSAAVHTAVADQGITLISYRDLPALSVGAGSPKKTPPWRESS